MRRLRGLKTLIHDAIDATTDLVREGHESAARTATRITDAIPPLAGPGRTIDEVRRFATDGTLASVVAVNRIVETLSDKALDYAITADDLPERPVTMRSDILKTTEWITDASLGALNASIGDQLSHAGSALDLKLRLRWADEWLDLDGPLPIELAATARPKIVVLVHGMATTEWSWSLQAHDLLGDPAAHFGKMLERDRGVTAIYVRYNTGRKISVNGAALAEALEGLFFRWPVPVEEITLVCHSMGGLISRSALRKAHRDELRFLPKVRRFISLGTPHQGAPLARFGDLATYGLGNIDLPATRIISRILGGRSAGVQDLNTGQVVDEKAFDPKTVALTPGVAWLFVSGSVTQDPDHVVGTWLGDLLVTVASASGPGSDDSGIEIHRVTLGGVMHHQLQAHSRVYEEILAFMKD